MPRRKRADPVAVTFGSYVRLYRMQKGETLQAIADKLSMGPAYLGELERGWHVPGINTCKRLADALEIPLSELVKEL